MMGYKRRHTTQEQIDFIRDCMEQGMSTRECAWRFSEVFSEPLGQTQCRRIMSRNGIKATKPENRFLPIGTERWCDYYQCMMVKTGEYHYSKSDSDGDYRRNQNWELKQNVIWEKEHGKLPWRWVVIFLDGNRMNYSKENLFAVPLNVAGTIEKMRMHSENAEIYKTALIWGELYYLMKERQKHEAERN